MGADTQDVVFELDDRVATLTLNRPDRLNALSDAMIDSAVAVLRRCSRPRGRRRARDRGGARFLCRRRCVRDVRGDRCTADVRGPRRPPA